MRKPLEARMTAPQVFIPAVKVPQPDGSVLFKAGKPVIIGLEVGTKEAARILGMSRRGVETECSFGRFKTAHKPGNRLRSIWKIARAELLARVKNEPE